MKHKAFFKSEYTINAIAMFVAPLILAASSIVSLSGHGNNSDALGGSLVVYAFFAFIFVILGLTHLLIPHAPRFALIMRIVGIFGCIGGVNWGMNSAIRGVLLTKTTLPLRSFPKKLLSGVYPSCWKFPASFYPLAC